jgi:hypothetical protein
LHLDDNEVRDDNTICNDRLFWIRLWQLLARPFLYSSQKDFKLSFLLPIATDTHNDLG